jgi:hypothetical protein
LEKKTQTPWKTISTQRKQEQACKVVLSLMLLGVKFRENLAHTEIILQTHATQLPHDQGYYTFWHTCVTVWPDGQKGNVQK